MRFVTEPIYPGILVFNFSTVSDQTGGGSGKAMLQVKEFTFSPVRTWM